MSAHLLKVLLRISSIQYRFEDLFLDLSRLNKQGPLDGTALYALLKLNLHDLNEPSHGLQPAVL